MASERLRKGAGASGSVATSDGEAKVKRQDHVDDIERASTQAEIIAPKEILFECESEAGIRTISMPTEFSLRDIVRRRILDDIDALSRLILTEARRVAPADIAGNPARFFEPDGQGYLEVALSRSNVRESLREIVMNAGHIVRSDRVIERPTNDDVYLLSSNDLMMLAVYLFRRWLEQIGSGEKNALRTALA